MGKLGDVVSTFIVSFMRRGFHKDRLLVNLCSSVSSWRHKRSLFDEFGYQNSNLSSPVLCLLAYFWSMIIYLNPLWCQLHKDSLSALMFSWVSTTWCIMQIPGANLKGKPTNQRNKLSTCILPCPMDFFSLNAFLKFM